MYWLKTGQDVKILIRDEKANSEDQNQCNKDQLEIPKQKEKQLQLKTWTRFILKVEIKGSSEDDFFGSIQDDLVLRGEGGGGERESVPYFKLHHSVAGGASGTKVSAVNPLWIHLLPSEAGSSYKNQNMDR